MTCFYMMGAFGRQQSNPSALDICNLTHFVPLVTRSIPLENINTEVVNLKKKQFYAFNMYKAEMSSLLILMS